MGWGRLGSRLASPIRWGFIDDRFDGAQRRQSGGGGGETRGESFFRGDAAIFGGLSYRLARAPPLTLIAEYESDQYDREVQLGTLENLPLGILACRGSLGQIVEIQVHPGCEAIL